MLLFDTKVKYEFVKPETEGLLVIALQTNIYGIRRKWSYFTNIKESRRKNLPRNIFVWRWKPIEIAVLNYIREAYNQEK